MSDESKNNEIPPVTSRRRFLKRAAGLIGGGVVFSWLSACGDQPTPQAQTTTAAAPTSTPTTLAPTTTAAATTAPTTAAPTTAALTTTVAPTPTPQPIRFNFNVYGDIRTAGLKPPPIFDQLLKMSKTNNPEAAVILGDIINSETDNNYVKQQWATLRKAFEPLGSNVPLLPTIGNHDTNYREGAVPLYIQAFPELPKNGPKDFTGFVYSLDLGPVHFVCLASELPSQPHQHGKVQLDWLEQDLKANKQPYTIVFSHDPAYPVGPHLSDSLDVFPKERDSLLKLLVDYKVTAYLAGHEHLYNRSVRNGINQLIIGTSGSSPYSGYGGDYYHYATFNVNSDGMQVTIIDEAGKQRDQFTLKPR
jgi:predicted phosphodiesterase